LAISSKKRRQGRYGDEVSIALRQPRTLPHVPEKNAVGELPQLGKDVANLAVDLGTGSGLESIRKTLKGDRSP
jgi:hypothetical protein